MSDQEQTPSRGQFKYHLELTPAQLKITHTALHALLNDFGHEEKDVHEVIREVLDKLPDEHAMRAIRLDTELDRAARGESGPPAALDEPESTEGGDEEGPPPVVA